MGENKWAHHAEQDKKDRTEGDQDCAFQEAPILIPLSAWGVGQKICRFCHVKDSKAKQDQFSIRRTGDDCGDFGAGGGDVLNLTQWGVAGLMGGLWWWERKYSRQREEELTEAHQRIVSQGEHLSAVLDALQGNTKVIADFTAVQGEILRVMRGYQYEETKHEEAK